MRKSCLFFILAICLSFQMIWSGSANNIVSSGRQPNAPGRIQQLQTMKTVQDSLFKKDDPHNQQERTLRTREFVGKMDNLMRNKQDHSFDPQIMLLPPAERTERLKALINSEAGKQKLRLDATSIKDDSFGSINVANTIYLPESIELSGETLIVANQLILEKEESFIRGNGNLYIILTGPITTERGKDIIPKLWVEMKVENINGSHGNRIGNLPLRTERNFVYSPETISSLLRPNTLDLRTVSMNGKYNKVVSAAYLPLQGASQGSTGSSGTAGPNGGNGGNGAPRPCSSHNGNGRAGDTGQNGQPGGKGGKGGTGGAGTDGWDCFFYTEFGGCNSYNFNYTSHGLYGGQGGDGGTGGQGGDGGTGGNGANGANCSCSTDGHGGGNGGAGGGGGTGGKGGDGGDGGTGGKGGNGGNLYVFLNACTYAYSNFECSSQGGFGGTGGYGGASAPSGSSNSAGSAGSGGLGIGSGCPNGDDGAPGAAPGTPASAYSGSQGSWGMSGSNGTKSYYWEA
jgi:hypothetical protein